MLIYIIRHGETDLNNKGCIQGHIDVPLNEHGRYLATLTGQGLKDVHFDYCISSPSDRAMETAWLVLAENKAGLVPKILTDSRLMETNWGIWEGKGCVPGNYEVPIEWHEKLWSDTFHFQPPEGAESPQEVIDRLTAMLDDVIHTPEYQGKTILLSTHGMALRGMLNPYYEDPSDYWHGGVPMNCVVNILEEKDGDVRLIGDDLLYYDPSLSNEIYNKG